MKHTSINIYNKLQHRVIPITAMGMVLLMAFQCGGYYDEPFDDLDICGKWEYVSEQAALTATWPTLHDTIIERGNYSTMRDVEFHHNGTAKIMLWDGAETDPYQYETVSYNWRMSADHDTLFISPLNTGRKSYAWRIDELSWDRLVFSIERHYFGPESGSAELATFTYLKVQD